MTTCSLTLFPGDKSSFTIGLTENDGYRDTAEGIVERSAGSNSIFSDLSYEFLLRHENLDHVQDVRVYINDTYESSVFHEGWIRFPASGYGNRKIFLDCYGFVALSLTLVMHDGSEQTLTSEYLPVLVRRGQLNDAVHAMVDYVYRHRESLLLNGEPRPRNMAGLKEGGYQSLTAQILLAEQIAAIYEASYGYFKANSRFRIEKVAAVERLERLQYVTPATLAYIASHPEQLKTVNSNAGIRVGNRIYQPEKTLSMQNVNSYDIYENRVIVCFLRKMVDEVSALRERCNQLLDKMPDAEDYSSEYIFSSYFMFAETRRMLEKGVQQLSWLYDKFALLWGMYCNILPISPEPLGGAPRPTAVFLSVPQYHKLFVHIHQWFSFGIYDFEKENFMLSFIKISSLYESYLLTKMIAYFSDRGYTRVGAKRCHYPVSRKWKYKNTGCTNTFCFSDGKHRITLYYQPVIFDTDRSDVNGIGLYRNNSIPIYSGDHDDRWGGHYYAPDYLVKAESENGTKYLILDAKFSDAETVRRYHVRDLAFKYLFSISPVSSAETVTGLCIIYGKCTENELLQSAYDNQLPDHPIKPLAEILPLIEGVDSEEQYNKLDMLLKTLLT